MARFLYKFSYSKEGMQGVLKEGAANRRSPPRPWPQRSGPQAPGSMETVVLLSAEDVDRAIATNVPYRAPGA